MHGYYNLVTCPCSENFKCYTLWKELQIVFLKHRHLYVSNMWSRSATAPAQIYVWSSFNLPNNYFLVHDRAPVIDIEVSV